MALGRNLLQSHYNSTVNLPFFHPPENIIDVFQIVPGEMGNNLAFRRKLQGFLEVLTRSYDRATYGDAFQHGLENW